MGRRQAATGRGNMRNPRKRDGVSDLQEGRKGAGVSKAGAEARERQR